ncbi:hypothetical protein EH204_16835 [Pectobacterium carotovorum subsp. carotovorum]|nr:hypothetical protein EH204_16835 [Pectobacterium carotovorum subsp. carotovorum]
MGVFLFKNIIFALFSISFLFIIYILLGGYAPWNEKTIHLIIAIVVCFGLGKFFTWLDEK